MHPYSSLLLWMAGLEERGGEHGRGWDDGNGMCWNISPSAPPFCGWFAPSLAAPLSTRGPTVSPARTLNSSRRRRENSNLIWGPSPLNEPARSLDHGSAPSSKIDRVSLSSRHRAAIRGYTGRVKRRWSSHGRRAGGQGSSRERSSVVRGGALNLTFK